MGLPDPKTFTFPLLLKRFQERYGERVTKELLTQWLIDGEEIKGTPIYQQLQRGGGFVNAYKREEPYTVNGPRIGWNIPSAEVLRFEAEHPPEQDVPASTAETIPQRAIMGIDETPELFVSRLRSEGKEDADIAWELYRQDKSLERVGRIFHPDPPSSDPTTYTHRGKKFLKLK